MTDKEENQLPFGWTQKPDGRRGYMDLYNRHGWHRVCLPEGSDSRDCVFESVERETGLSREALEMSIWCSENLDTQQPRTLFESAEFRIIRIHSGESAIILSESGDVADAFLGHAEDVEGPVNAGVTSATVAISAINNSDFRAHVMAELDGIAADIEDEQ